MVEGEGIKVEKTKTSKREREEGDDTVTTDKSLPVIDTQWWRNGESTPLVGWSQKCQHNAEETTQRTERK